MYFDNNATTRPCDAAVEAMNRASRELWHNPSSVHKAGQGVRHAVEVARADVARVLKVKPRECTFVSGGTEGLDMALRGLLALTKSESKPVLLTSRVEHAAIRDLAEWLEKSGAATVHWMPLDDAGVVDAVATAELMERIKPSVVALQWANNETGVVQPVRAVGLACRKANAKMVIDGTQWVGKCEVDDDLSAFADVLVCSAHKFHGCKGCGIVWARQGVRMRPALLGTQELGQRGGTENVPAILAAGAAATSINLEASATVSQMRDWLEAEVVRGVAERAPGLRVVVNRPREATMMDAGVQRPSRLWNTTNIGFATLEAEALLIAMSERGVMASAGAACSSGSLEPSPVLLAMGVAPEVAHGSIRLSLSRETTWEEVRRGAQVIVDVVARVGASMPRA